MAGEGARGWANTFQRLIGAGHRRDDILEYSIDEIGLYLREIDILERERMADQVVVTRAGAQGTPQAVDTLIRELLGRKRNG